MELLTNPIITSVISFIGGVVVTAWVGYKFTDWRDDKNRKHRLADRLVKLCIEGERSMFTREVKDIDGARETCFHLERFDKEIAKKGDEMINCWEYSCGNGPKVIRGSIEEIQLKRMKATKDANDISKWIKSNIHLLR